MTQREPQRTQRGLVLSLVLMTSIIFAMTAYMALVWALTRVRAMPITLRQVQARYAAEGGLAWAMQRLFVDQRWESPEGYDVRLKGNPSTWGDPSTWKDPPPTLTNGLPVDIIIPPCTSTPCGRRSLQAKVVY